VRNPEFFISEYGDVLAQENVENNITPIQAQLPKGETEEDALRKAATGA